MTTATLKRSILLLPMLGLVFWLGCSSSGLTPLKIPGLSKASDSDGDAPAPRREELPPKDAAKACMAAAQELQNSGHAEQAIALYEKARKNDPDLKSVSHRLAVLYDSQGDSTRALVEYKRAVQADPKNPNLLSDFGYYYYERGNLSEAEQWLRKALALDPNHQKALSNLGLLLAQQGRWDDSFQAFSQVVGPAAAHSNVGVLLAKQGHYEEAKQAFQRALALDSTLPQPKAFLDYLDHRKAGSGVL